MNVRSGTIVHPFSPVFDNNSHTLILGSMPSPRSRENGFYYGHPQNRFWSVLAAVFKAPCPRSNEEKCAFVLSRGIALWDVLQSCSIAGADDASIREPQVNDLSALIKAGVKRVFTTGKAAHRLYITYCAPLIGIEAAYLPSTSAANRGRWPLEKLIEAYRVIGESV